MIGITRYIKAVALQLMGLLTLSLLPLGCSSGVEDYPIPPSRDGRAYSLSSDTVSLDTLPSLLLSSTYSLRLFNPEKRPLELASIRLKSGGSSGFRLNVDGRAEEAERLRIEGRDSIFIFVRAYLPEGESDSPTPVGDSIVVTDAEGRRSYIPIVAVRQNVRHISELIVRSDLRLEDPRPLLIKDSIYIAQDARLTLAPQTRLLMSAKAHVRVEGELRAEGTAEGRIRFESVRRDRFLPRVSYARVPGQWGGIVVGKSGRIWAEYMELTNAKWGIYFEDSEGEQTERRLSLAHCRLHNLSGLGISASRGQYLIEDSELSNTLGTTLSLSGGIYTIKRSSIINFYPWPGIRTTASLFYTNTPRRSTEVEASSRLVLEHCVLDGSLGVAASGASGGELELSLRAGQAGQAATVRLVKSYLRARAYTSPQVEQQEVLYADRQREPHKVYARMGLDSLGRKDYLFDYRPMPDAPFTGLLRGANNLPPDLSGKVRPEPATYGAYEPINK